MFFNKEVSSKTSIKMSDVISADKIVAIQDPSIEQRFYNELSLACANAILDDYDSYPSRYNREKVNHLQRSAQAFLSTCGPIARMVAKESEHIKLTINPR